MFYSTQTNDTGIQELNINNLSLKRGVYANKGCGDLQRVFYQILTAKNTVRGLNLYGQNIII